MRPEELKKKVQLLTNVLLVLFIITSGVFFLTIYSMFYKPKPEISLGDFSEIEAHIENGIDLESGLLATGNYELVKKNCTPCHSGKLIVQNKATREGWKSMINWMQETQGLWDLGENQDEILDYLESCYGPEKIGRRKNLENIDWYELQP